MSIVSGLKTVDFIEKLLKRALSQLGQTNEGVIKQLEM